MRIGEPVPDAARASPRVHYVAMAVPGSGVPLLIESPSGPADIALLPVGLPLPAERAVDWMCTTPCMLYAPVGRYRAISRVGGGGRTVTRLVLPFTGAHAQVRPAQDRTAALVLMVAGVVLMVASPIAIVAANVIDSGCFFTSCTLPDALLVGGYVALLVGPGLLAAGLAADAALRGGVRVDRGPPRFGQRWGVSPASLSWTLAARGNGVVLGAGLAF